MTAEPAPPPKPLDTGAGGITASVNAHGRLIAVNGYSSRHGYLTLSATPPFPDADRYQPEKVRAYRRGLAQDDGFGVAFESPVVAQEAWLEDDLYPHVRLSLADGESAECVTWAVAGVGVAQAWRLSSPGVRYRLDGRVWFQRCAYTQLTEGGVLPFPSPGTHLLSPDDPARRLTVLHNPALAQYVALGISNARPADPADPQAGVILTGGDLHPTPDGALMLAVAFGDSADLALSRCESLLSHSAPPPPPVGWFNLPPDPLLKRGLAYGLLCAVPLDDDGARVCILTDHMILPLAWNRDAYYVARALLAWDSAHAPLVRGHLAWMFETAERVNGLWGRSYTANGAVKDRGYQLDQQIYPLLELCEYAQITGDPATLTRYTPHLREVVRRLDEQANAHGLYPTAETPGDDPIPLPYHFSSHVLLWAVFRDLAMWDALGDADAWRARADALHRAIHAHFVAHHDEFGAVYAYATDGAGNFHLYHDANDLPLALAPVWGFCPADDPVWRATVAFAFSPANVGGYYGGHLGSVHTPAAWALGDVQDWIIALALDDRDREQRALDRLRRAAQPDGALPEAYDPSTGAVVSRHWFAWPSAAYACVRLGAWGLTPHPEEDRS